MSPRGEAAIPWNAASRWRTSGGRRTTSASIRESGLDSIETVRRCRSTAARATQPPRPNRSATTSPGPVCCSIRAATTAGGGAGEIRSKTGSEKPGRASRGPRPVIRQMLADGRYAWPMHDPLTELATVPAVPLHPAVVATRAPLAADRRRPAGDPRRRARAPLALAAVRHRRARRPLRPLSRPRVAGIGDRGDRHRARRWRRSGAAGRTGDPGTPGDGGRALGAAGRAGRPVRRRLGRRPGRWRVDGPADARPHHLQPALVRLVQRVVPEQGVRGGRGHPPAGRAPSRRSRPRRTRPAGTREPRSGRGSTTSSMPTSPRTPRSTARRCASTRAGWGCTSRSTSGSAATARTSANTRSRSTRRWR